MLKKLVFKLIKRIFYSVLMKEYKHCDFIKLKFTYILCGINLFIDNTSKFYMNIHMNVCVCLDVCKCIFFTVIYTILKK